MSIDSPWCPIIGRNDPGGSEGLRQQVIEAILAIARALSEPVDDLGLGRLPVQAFDLPDGSAGTALFFTYLARASRSEPALGDAHHWAELAMCHINHAIQGVADIPMAAGLFGGFSGIGWAAVHIEAALDDLSEAEAGGTAEAAEESPTTSAAGEDVEGADIADEIDQALVRMVRVAPWHGHHDLISGLVGFGVYALERLPHPAGRACLIEIVARLDELAHRDARGITWHTPAAHLPARQHERWPAGIYDLGLAHGLPGIIGLLAEIHAAGIERDRARMLLDGAVRWLLDHSSTPESTSGFPWAYIPGVESRPTRAAWCYGDPGIAAALARAATCADMPAWAAGARELALTIAGRPHELTGVVDVGLCHGSAGLLHICGRLYQVMAEPALRDAALSWTTRTLNMRADDGVAGFRALTRTPDTDIVWIPERGLLNGAAGVGLAMIAAVTDVPPAWDRVLLLSGRSRRQEGGEKAHPAS